MGKTPHSNQLSQYLQPITQNRFLQFQVLVLISMYIGYAAFMLCRNTLIACSVEIIQDPALGIDKESFGHLMSWHSAGAILGKLVTGPGADLLGGRRMFLLALSLTAIANIGFAFSSSFIMFAGFNFFGQAAKAGGWPAMAQIVRSWYPETRYGQVWSIIATSSRVGTIAAGLLFGYLLTLIEWRTVFLLSAVLTASVVVLLFFTLKQNPEDAGLQTLLEPSEDPTTKNGSETKGSHAHAFDHLTLRQACLAFVQSGRFWFIAFSIVFLTIVMDFLNFIPIYLAEELRVSASTASMAGTAFPAGMFTALLLTSFFYDRLSKQQLIIALGAQLIFSCLAVLLLWKLDFIAASLQPPIAIITLFLLGLAISPAYYVPMSVFSVAFGGKHAGFLVAVIDIFGYAAALIFNYFGGSIAKQYGWPVFLSGLLTVAALATLCMVTFLTLDYLASKRLSNESWQAKRTN